MNTEVTPIWNVNGAVCDILWYTWFWKVKYVSFKMSHLNIETNPKEQCFSNRLLNYKCIKDRSSKTAF